VHPFGSKIGSNSLENTNFQLLGSVAEGKKNKMT
jgi:hypothetical protein